MARQKDWTRRLVVRAFIKAYFIEHGQAPTGREIAQACHCPHGKVGGMLRDLADRGWIIYHGGYRGIELPQRD